MIEYCLSFLESSSLPCIRNWMCIMFMLYAVWNNMNGSFLSFSQKNQDKGKIARSGDISMVETIEAEGYETVSTST